MHCESEINQVSLVQYVRAGSPESAMALVKQGGVVPLRAERIDDSADWTLDALNRTARAIAGAHDEVRSLRQFDIMKSPSWTIFCAVTAALLFWTIVAILVQSCIHLR